MKRNAEENKVFEKKELEKNTSLLVVVDALPIPPLSMTQNPNLNRLRICQEQACFDFNREERFTTFGGIRP